MNQAFQTEVLRIRYIVQQLDFQMLWNEWQPWFSLDFLCGAGPCHPNPKAVAGDWPEQWGEAGGGS